MTTTQKYLTPISDDMKTVATAETLTVEHDFKGLWLVLFRTMSFLQNRESHSKGLKDLDADLRKYMSAAQSSSHEHDSRVFYTEAANVLVKINSLYENKDGTNEMGFRIALVLEKN